MSTMMEDMWFDAAQEALHAFDACKPTPVVFGQAVSLFGNEIVPGTEEYLADGVCGFAWVNVKPARGPFVMWMKARGIGDKGIYGGYRISFYDICPSRTSSQSMERKEAACRAFVKRIKEHFPDMKIWAESRMD